MKHRLILLVSSLLLAACAAPLLVQDGKLAPPVGQGYVIVAITLDSFDHEHADAGVHLDGPAGEIKLEAKVMDMVRAPGQEKDGQGKLHVVALPAGRYRISEVYGSWIDDSFHRMRMRSRSAFPLTDAFELKAGEVVYLGDYHVSLNFQPSYSRSNAQRRDFNDLLERQGVKDFSNIRLNQP